MPDESLNSDWSVYNHCSGKPSVQENHSEPALLSDAAMRGTAESPGSITSIPQARQRRRVAVACNECRVKKTRVSHLLLIMLVIFLLGFADDIVCGSATVAAQSVLCASPRGHHAATLGP